MGGVEGNSLTKEVTPKRQEAMREVLADAIRIIEDEGAPYVAAGSLASTTWGRPGSVGDVDVVIDPGDAKRLLKAFEAAGYETEETYPQWLYKAKKGEVTVDLIFELEGAMYLDEKMVEKAPIKDVEGVRVRLMAPEDYVISQALSTKEDTPDYWYNGLGVISKTELDWDYLVERASRGPRRVLSLLAYAQSNDLSVPDAVIRRVFEATYGS